MAALSNVYGKIKVIALVASGDLAPDAILASYGRLMEAFRDRTTFVFLGFQNSNPMLPATTDNIRTAMDDAHLHSPHHIVMVDAQHPDQSLPPNQWIQDPFVVMDSQDGQLVLVEPFEFRHDSNKTVAECLSNGYEVLIKATDLALEGGNILVGDDYMLVGEDLVQKNIQSGKFGLPGPAARQQVLDKLGQTFKMGYVFPVGDATAVPDPLQLNPSGLGHQPLFHLDQFVTLGGISSERHHQGDELIFVADLPGDPHDNLKTHIRGIGPLAPEWSHVKQLKQRLDQCATYFKNIHLHQPGPQFHVVRFPLALDFSNSTQRPVVYSYNNCLVEWYDGIRRIYLPDYARGHPHDTFRYLQEKLRDKLLGLDFRVTWVNASFRTYARQGGSLNCLTKVLRRI